MDGQYFVSGKGITQGMYHVFYRGRFDGSSCYRDDSLLINDNDLWTVKGLIEALCDAVPGYDVYGKSIVTPEQWREVGMLIQSKDRESQIAYAEADSWAQDVFKSFDCFTIIGL